ncbi:MAG: VWA domain-containing protein [Sneathiellaceae bacterium]
MISRLSAAGLVACGLAAMAPAPAAAATNLLFVFDASNSMWGQVNAVPKIQTARETLSGLIADLPADTRVGLLAYGHRSKDDCADVEMLVPFGADTRAAVVTQLASLQPRGKTPIAFALQRSGPAFDGVADGAKSIVLISDGVETCDGDPCKSAAELAASGIGVKVHVVGFDIAAKDRAQLECIAEKGGGRYFPADGTDGFSTAVGEAVQVAQADTQKTDAAPEPAPPAPKEPVRERVFFDDFEGLDLAEQWVVNNPNPDAYIVEDNVLLMLNGGTGGFGAPEAQNLVQLSEALPKGDWDAKMTFTVELATGRDRVTFGLRKDAENWLAATLSYTEAYCSAVTLSLVKMTGGKATSFDHAVSAECNAVPKAFAAKLADTPSTLTLQKRGRSYAAQLQIADDLDKDGTQILYQTDRLTSLRAPGSLTVGVDKYEDRQGEILIHIDSIEIETVTD